MLTRSKKLFVFSNARMVKMSVGENTKINDQENDRKSGSTGYSNSYHKRKLVTANLKFESCPVLNSELGAIFIFLHPRLVQV